MKGYNPRFVVIDPRIAFGRLVITNTGIATSIIKERYWAGDSIDHLAEDYQCDRLMIEKAICCELSAVALVKDNRLRFLLDDQMLLFEIRQSQNE